MLAQLREPRGDDELATVGVDTRSAVSLLDRLLDLPPCPAHALSASDRDRLLATLHRALWGDRIVASLECPGCDAPFDLSFELSSIQRQLSTGAEPVRVDAPRSLETADGKLYLLPSSQEEDEAAQLGIDAGGARLRSSICAQELPPESSLDERLEVLAPIIDVELAATCAECGRVAHLRFDVQSFVLQRLLDEREGLLDEVHVLANSYHWPLSEILALPRGVRRSLVQRSTTMSSPWG